MNLHETYCIIVTYQPEIEKLKQVVQSIATNNCQIIIVDNTDGKTEFVDFPRHHTIYLNNNKGISYAQNVGIRLAIEKGADYIWLSDQDTIYSNDFLEKMLAAAADCRAHGINLGALAPVYFDEKKGAAQPFVQQRPLTHKFTPTSGLNKISHAIASGTIIPTKTLEITGLMQEDLFIDWANDNGVAVMKWLAAQKSNPGFVNVPDDSAVSKFGNGDVAAIETGPWNYPDAVKALGEDKIGVAVYPKVKIGDQEVQQKAFMGVKLYAVNQKPAKGNKERIIAAYKLASFLTSEKSQENQFATRSIVPSNKNVQASEAVTSDPLAKAVAEMTGSSDHTVVMPKISQMGTFWNLAAPLLSGPYSGKIAEADYMAKLEQFDKDLAESK